MPRRLFRFMVFLSFLFMHIKDAEAQEHIGPIRWNPFVAQGARSVAHSTQRTTAALSLPFFEDFAGKSVLPDSSKWADFEVYINNTMAVNPISMGVATFDDLNAKGLPYDSFYNTIVHYADSLTSLPIDLSNDSVGDSLYLSFFYQLQGNGYYPTATDSLMLFFRNRFGDFVKVWSVPGIDTPLSSVGPFQQVMIPLTDSLDFKTATFQFRFVNTASFNFSDANWNVDYIRLDRHRSFADTTVADVAFSSNPSFLLNDYTFMTYYQFEVSPLSEISSQLTDTVRNDTSFGQSVSYNYSIVDQGTMITLAAGAGLSSAFFAGYQGEQITEPFFIRGFPSYGQDALVDFKVQYYIQQTPSTGPTVNDTMVRHQYFSNYLAYDDGTAEKSYYLELQTSTPGRIAIEYHLNRPDTLRGLSIYFGRQVPNAYYKLFLIDVYSTLQGVNGASADNFLYNSSTLLNPAYVDTINHFWTYLLDTPLYLPAGIFYVGTSQSYDDGSDSLYYGFDVNRVGPNHVYYNVLGGNWQTSQFSGAIMMRPVLGNPVSGTAVRNMAAPGNILRLIPNPAHDRISLLYPGDGKRHYSVIDVLGRVCLAGEATAGQQIDIGILEPGSYFVELDSDNPGAPSARFVKQ